MIVAFAVALQVQAAAVPHLAFTHPTVIVDHDFTQIRGLRELVDGRVLVTDRLEEKVYVLQPKTGAIQTIGRPGRGPAEYHLPTAVFATPGDSSVLIDEGNARIAIIGPDLRISRSFALMIPDVPMSSGPRGRDARGRYIAQIPGWFRARGPAHDTVDIVRFDATTQRVDTIASVRGYTRPNDGGYRATPGFGMVPFMPQDVWTVAPDGAIAIVRSGDYHVEWIAPDGKATRGAPVPFEAIPVTTADKYAYTRRFSELSSIGGKDPNGGMTATPAEFRSAAAIKQMVETNVFSTVKGPFTDSAPIVAGDGSLWVERSAPDGSAPRYDIFNRTGRRVRTAQLPRGRRLIAVGRESAYLVSEDSDGLQHLELHPIL